MEKEPSQKYIRREKERAGARSPLFVHSGPAAVFTISPSSDRPTKGSAHKQRLHGSWGLIIANPLLEAARYALSSGKLQTSENWGKGICRQDLNNKQDDAIFSSTFSTFTSFCLETKEWSSARNIERDILH
jgi:hypothetical protein